MPAYMVLIRDNPVHDAEAMAQYQRINRENAGKIKVAMKPLVIYGAAEALEGPTPDGMLILQFDSAADAKAWYEDPLYQEALPYRLKAAEYRAIVVEGL